MAGADLERLHLHDRAELGRDLGDAAQQFARRTQRAEERGHLTGHVGAGDALADVPRRMRVVQQLGCGFEERLALPVRAPCGVVLELISAAGLPGELQEPANSVLAQPPAHEVEDVPRRGARDVARRPCVLVSGPRQQLALRLDHGGGIGEPARRVEVPVKADVAPTPRSGTRRP
jgi:hypothetical protein